MKQDFHFHDDVIVLSIRYFDNTRVIFKIFSRVRKIFFFFNFIQYIYFYL